MATIKCFEEIEAWQLARILCSDIDKITRQGPFAKDFELRNQINRSSGSVMDNIAEGFELGGNKEFVHFLSIAKGSCGEVRSQLYRAFDRNYINNIEFDSLKEKCIVVSKKISGLSKYLQSTDFKGHKFHEPDEPYLDNLTLNIEH
jgi:four helix bundle protein